MSSTAADFASFRFSSDELPPTERIPFWREVIGHSLVKLDMERLGDEPYFYEGAFRALPGLGFATTASSPIRVRRTPRLIAEDGDDDLILNVVVSGTTFVSHLGRELTAAGGEATLMVNAEPGFVDVLSRARLLSLRLPFAALSPMISRFDPVHLSTIDASSEPMRLLTSYVALVERNFPLATAALRRTVVSHVHELAALAIGATRDAVAAAEGHGVRAARVNAIKADIAQNLGDVRLSVGAVAGRQRVTARYVQILFEAEGTTFSEFVLTSRLMHVHRMLVDPRFEDRTIGAIAFAAGFGDLSYFNTRFRRRFGVTPSVVRTEARRPQ